MPRITDTRERLIEAAIAVIETEGEHSLKIGAIARAVGVSAPSIYHFFADREGLVVAALAEMYRRSQIVGTEILMASAASASTVEEFKDAVRNVVYSVTDDDGTRRRMLQTTVLGAAVTRPQLQSSLVEVHRRVAAGNQAFADLGRKRGFVRDNFKPEVLALFASALFTDRHYAEIDEDIDRAEWDAIVFETLRHLLFDHIDRSNPHDRSDPSPSQTGD